MRPITQSDICGAARVVARAPRVRQEGVARALISGAHRADRFRRATGRHHPGFGDGSLLSAALAVDPSPLPVVGDRDLLEAMGLVIEQVLTFLSGDDPE